jgi:Spy/CpxP family protein refolding chaperone
MKWWWGLMVAFMLGVPLGGAAQESEEKADPFSEVFFAPEFIMQHRRAIELTDEQRDAITGAIQDLQGRAVSRRFELLDEVQTLLEILSEREVDLDRAMDQVDEFLDTENDVKRAQFELLIRIKNILTPEQQETLEALREERRP